MPGPFEIKKEQETVVLIGVASRYEDHGTADEHINELAFLVDTAGGIPLKSFIQSLDYPDPRTFVGSGKLDEIRSYVKERNVDIAVFDDELSPSQLRNIEKVLDCKVIDRNNLILDIFAGRARTAHAKTQVELAQYEYLLPRLTRMWTHLSKQKGGIGMKGPGETEIETDRRIIRDRIALLKKKLVQIDKQKATQRKNRGKLVRVALVGYTNVGKSTLMNLLSKSDVFAEDKLFATLDTTVRKVVLQNLPFLLSDTVGFIRKLPHSLIESFKSTLDEVREADILVHIVDISHPDFEDQISTVQRTLTEINAFDKPSIMVFNKIDAYSFVEQDEDDLSPPEKENLSLDELKKTWMAGSEYRSVFISAREKTNIEALRDILYEEVKIIHAKRYPYNSYLYDIPEFPEE
ncbi:MAG: GTPase HflX [Bacteroidales bacterium]|jgi:GTP-binding protein HflX|nr:GTPase HflX [Bacteroidales bacterium]